LALKLCLVIAAALALGATMSAAHVSAGSATLAIESARGNVGEEVSVDLRALGIPEPGLGAWTVDVTYDPTVVDFGACRVGDAGGACGPRFTADTDRIVGASEMGLVGDIILATMTYQCDAAGVSPLELNVSVFADSTAADMDYTAVNGSITCLAGPETVGIGSLVLGVGEQGPVDLDALNVPPPGVGSWTVDIVFDPAIVSAVECAPQTAPPVPICDLSFASDTVRLIGASASGLSGDATLAVITLRCEAEGASALTIDTDNWSTACPGFCDREPETQNGTISCVGPSGATATIAPLLPPTGTGGEPVGSAGWLIALLTGTGAVALACLAMMRLRARPRS
jgi:hypothetical protein